MVNFPALAHFIQLFPSNPPEKISENIWFSDVFRVYRKR